MACSKSLPGFNVKELLFTETVDHLKKGEPLSLNFGDDDATEAIEWKITPNTNSTISVISNNALIIFSVAGQYQVTATKGNVYAIYNITVDDIPYIINYGSDFVFTASKLVDVKVNEMVQLAAKNAPAGSGISWSLTPSSGGLSYDFQHDDINKTGTLVLHGAGYVNVEVTVGSYTQRRTIFAYDPTIPIPTQNDFSFMMGDKLQLTPSVEQAGSSKKLVITAKTTRKYHCSTDKILSYSFNGDLQIDYSGVGISPKVCTQRSEASAVNSFKNIGVGVHPFVINLGNKTYTGTVTLDNTGTYTFNWPNTSEVSFTKLSVK